MAEFRVLATPEIASVAQIAGGLDSSGGVAVVADSDRWLRFVRMHCNELAGLGWQVLHPREDAIDICLDKSAFLRWCATNGLSAPRWFDETIAAQMDSSAYPLMVRPEWTQHSSNTGLPKAIEVSNHDQLIYWQSRFGAAGVRLSICESLLREGILQFSVGAARDERGRVRTFVAEKIRPHALQCAGGTFVVKSRQDDVEQLAVQALDKLDLFGIAEVEVLYDAIARRGYLIEVNARPWLQFGLPYACGCDLLDHMAGNSLRDSGRRRRSHAWLYFSSDLYACFARTDGLLRNGKIGVSQYLHSLLKSNVYAVWDWRDPRPALLSTLRSALSVVSRLFRPS
jgi:predicted ATP-grasp superfamily ATP-dependent carboligase